MKNYFEYKGYLGTCSFSADDMVFFGKVYGINDLITFEGTTPEELKQAFEEAVDDYLEMCMSVGKEPEKVYKGQFNVRIAPELHKQCAIKAVTEGISLNQMVENALGQYLNQQHIFHS